MSGLHPQGGALVFKMCFLYHLTCFICKHFFKNNFKWLYMIHSQCYWVYCQFLLVSTEISMMLLCLSTCVFLVDFQIYYCFLSFICTFKILCTSLYIKLLLTTTWKTMQSSILLEKSTNKLKILVSNKLFISIYHIPLVWLHLKK